MSPILGIWASSKPGAPSTSFESIATVTVSTSGISEINFNSIPNTYQHLQIRYLTRTARVNDGDSIGVRFNGDSGSNYFYQGGHFLTGNGTNAASSNNQSGTTTGTLPLVPAANISDTLIFGAGVADILDYQSTNKIKVLRALGGFDSNGGGRQAIDLLSFAWNISPIVAITSIKLWVGTTFNQNSHFALYGIRSA